jgi:hypothetical protein
MVEKVRLGGDAIPEWGFTQNPFAPKVVQPNRLITLEDVKAYLNALIVVAGNYCLEHSIQKAREEAIETWHTADKQDYRILKRKCKLTDREKKLLELYEKRISEYIKQHPDILDIHLKRQFEINGRDSYYANDILKTIKATQKLCKALGIEPPEMVYLESEELDEISRKICEQHKFQYLKVGWDASRLLCVLAYNVVYHYYKALPQEKVTQELNEAIKEFDHAITDLKISLDWE